MSLSFLRELRGRSWTVLGIVALTLLMSSYASGQERVAAVNRPDVAASTASPAEAIMSKAAAANRYVFLFLYRERTASTDTSWSVLNEAVGKFAGAAEAIPVAITDPTEAALVARFDATRSPMPMVLAIAPNGAITKAFSGRFNEAQLRQAFVSRGTADCLKGLQERKLVFLCLQPGGIAAPAGVAEFAADPRFAQATRIVIVDATDPNEAVFLRSLQVSSETAPLVVFMAPPGSIVGTFGVDVDKDQLAAKLDAAQSNPCAGGKCGPGGCGGPKK